MEISIHSPYTGRDSASISGGIHLPHFNPLSLYRERHGIATAEAGTYLFQSTLPIQGETNHPMTGARAFRFQSTLPIQGETEVPSSPALSYYHFNPLSLYRERRRFFLCHVSSSLFQSTLPIQGETPKPSGLASGTRNFNPLSLYRERQCFRRMRRLYGISIHSPYTGRDRDWRALGFCESISIHSPYTGRDMFVTNVTHVTIYFNPLSLYRERRWKSTQKWDDGNISIHSPYTGRDSNFAHKTPNIQPISYAKRQTKELFPTPTQQIITSLALISSISRCESPCIFMCTSHSH